VRHLSSRAAAPDHFDQLLAIEDRPVQIGGLSRRAGIATSVPIDPVAELTIRLVLIEALAERRILNRGRQGEDSQPDGGQDK
jgi:hypothetical protein